MLQVQRDRAMTAHGMTEDALPVHVGIRKVFCDHLGQLIRDVLIHLVVLRPRLLRGRQIEARALTQIISLIIRHIVATRARIRRNNHDSVPGGCPLQSGFLHHIRPAAGQAGEIPQHRHFLRIGLRRRIDRKPHRTVLQRALMIMHGQRAAKGLPCGYLGEGHVLRSCPFE